jgi:hypothetical protein
MIDGRGRALITDFSIAVSRPDEIAPGAGTPAYMAPEQVMGRELTVQTDLYALGLVMYEAFTGRRAITAQNIDERRRLVMTAEPVPPLPFRFARIRSRDPRIGLINPHADDPRPFSMVCGPFIFRYCPARCVGAVRTARNDYVRCPWGRFAPRSTTNQTVVVHGETRFGPQPHPICRLKRGGGCGSGRGCDPRAARMFYEHGGLGWARLRMHVLRRRYRRERGLSLRNQGTATSDPGAARPIRLDRATC